jgi:hypothetical protein
MLNTLSLPIIIEYRKSSSTIHEQKHTVKQMLVLKVGIKLGNREKPNEVGKVTIDLIVDNRFLFLREVWYRSAIHF